MWILQTTAWLGCDHYIPHPLGDIPIVHILSINLFEKPRRVFVIAVSLMCSGKLVPDTHFFINTEVGCFKRG